MDLVSLRAKRLFKLPKSRQKPRTEVESANIPVVDAFLKSLRQHSRRIANLVHSHANEVQSLQRIVYKSKNQHKNAVFWRNVVELRRFSCRIEEANLSALMDVSRGAFYSQRLASAAAWKSTPWDVLPKTYFFLCILRRLNALCGLYFQAAQAYYRAFESLGRFSHSTAFLPLALVLMSIVARIWLLTTEMHEIAVNIWEDIHRLISRIDITHRKCVCTAPRPPSSRLQPPFNTPEPAMDAGMNAGEEVGETVNRMDIDGPQALNIQLDAPESEKQRDQTTQDEFEDTIAIDSNNLLIPLSSTKVTLETEPSHIRVAAPSKEVHRQEKKKTRKKPLDEIDAIFA